MNSSKRFRASAEPESLCAALREKAGDGSTNYRVEVWQSDLAEILNRLDNFTRQEWSLRNRAEVAERGHKACLAREADRGRV